MSIYIRTYSPEDESEKIMKLIKDLQEIAGSKTTDPAAAVMLHHYNYYYLN